MTRKRSVYAALRADAEALELRIDPGDTLGQEIVFAAYEHAYLGQMSTDTVERATQFMRSRTAQNELRKHLKGLGR